MARNVWVGLTVLLLAGCSSAPKLSWPTATSSRIPINSNYVIATPEAPATVAMSPIAKPVIQASASLSGQVVKLDGVPNSGKTFNAEQGFLDEPANGKNKIAFTATVNDASGKPAGEGIVVLWESTLGDLSAINTVTDSKGLTSIVLTAPKQSGWATVTARTEKKSKGQSSIVRYCSGKIDCREIGAYTY